MSVSTHVLDTARGRPAAGLAVTLSRRPPGGMSSTALEAGQYRLEYATGAYFKTSGSEGFYPEVSVVFATAKGDTHLHVPLLLSPFGYSTYKGQ